MFTTYVRKDFLDGTVLYGGENAYQEFVVKRQLWHSGWTRTRSLSSSPITAGARPSRWSQRSSHTDTSGPVAASCQCRRSNVPSTPERSKSNHGGGVGPQIGIPLAAFVYDCLATSLRRQTGHYRCDSLLWL